jgi:hypothetical protein
MLILLVSNEERQLIYYHFNVKNMGGIGLKIGERWTKMEEHTVAYKEEGEAKKTKPSFTHT